MKKRIIAISMIAAVAVALLFAGLLLMPSVSKPLKNPAKLYTDAVSGILSKSSVTASVTKDTTLSIGDRAFSATSAIAFTEEIDATQNNRYALQETFTCGSVTAQISEIYIDGTLYTTVQDGKFCCTLTDTDAAKRHPPVILLDPALYQSISGTTTATGATITFDSPKDAETWLLPENATFKSAQGRAYLDENMQLLKTEYIAQYSYAETAVTVFVTSEITGTNINPVSPPEDPETYINTENPNAPKILEVMTGYLLQANSITAQYVEHTSCQAFGDTLDKSVDLVISDTEKLVAEVDTVMTLSNSIHVDSITTLSQKEIFDNDVYQVSQNGGDPESDPVIADNIFREYCQNILIGTIIQPKHINGISISESDSEFKIIFTGNSEFANLICENICNTLYQNPTALTGLASDHYTSNLVCYLDISKNTCLPISSGIQYEGIFKIEGLPYSLEFYAEQNYSIN